MNIFVKFRAYLQLREAVRMADKAHQANGRRFYVLPTSDAPKGKPQLVVIDRFNFRKLKHKGYIPQKATVRDLVAESFYFTPYANGNAFITPDFQKRKARQFFQWYDAARRAAKDKRKGMKNG